MDGGGRNNPKVQLFVAFYNYYIIIIIIAAASLHILHPSTVNL